MTFAVAIKADESLNRTIAKVATGLLRIAEWPELPPFVDRPSDHLTKVVEVGGRTFTLYRWRKEWGVHLLRVYGHGWAFDFIENPWASDLKDITFQGNREEFDRASVLVVLATPQEVPPEE